MTPPPGATTGAAREVRFYREIAPRGSSPAPRCYYAAADDDAGRVVLLLDDRADARAGDALAGCSAAEAGLVLDAMAPFHARWWRLPPDAAPWLTRWGGDPDARRARYAGQVAPFLARFGPELPPAVRAVVEGLATRLADVLAALAGAPVTAVHADLHLDNILFGPVGAAPPVTVLDWQGISRGVAAVDVALFLVGSLAAEERRAAEDTLLRRYHTSLVEHGVDGYPLGRLRDDYCRAMLLHLVGTVGWLTGADPTTLAGRERALVDAALGDGRLIAALLDHAAAGLVAASRSVS